MELKSLQHHSSPPFAEHFLPGTATPSSNLFQSGQALLGDEIYPHKEIQAWSSEQFSSCFGGSKWDLEHVLTTQAVIPPRGLCCAVFHSV